MKAVTSVWDEGWGEGSKPYRYALGGLGSNRKERGDNAHRTQKDKRNCESSRNRSSALAGHYSAGVWLLLRKQDWSLRGFTFDCRRSACRGIAHDYTWQQMSTEPP